MEAVPFGSFLTDRNSQWFSRVHWQKKFSQLRPPSPPPDPRKVFSRNSTPVCQECSWKLLPQRWRPKCPHKTPLDHHRPPHCIKSSGFIYLFILSSQSGPTNDLQTGRNPAAPPPQDKPGVESRALVWTEVEIMQTQRFFFSVCFIFSLPLIWAAILLVFTAEYLLCFLAPRRPWITSRPAPNSLCTLGEIVCLRVKINK